MPVLFSKTAERPGLWDLMAPTSVIRTSWAMHPVVYYFECHLKAQGYRQDHV
jgi:hypothetical protein